jgi:hypothetical protein
MAIFCVSQKFYIADRAFFDLIFSFWHKLSKVKNRKKCFLRKNAIFEKSEIRLFLPFAIFSQKITN